MKKKIYLMTLAVLSIFALAACSSTSSSSSSASSKETATSSSKTVKSNFIAADTSDATIESISTYNDYLTMCQKIIDDYFTNYENAISGTVLDDGGTTLESIKQQSQASFETQKSQYGSLGNTKIVGKNTLVQYLKDYRDSLQKSVDSIVASIQ